MQTIYSFISNYWVHSIAFVILIGLGHKALSWLENGSIETLKGELEKLRMALHANPVTDQLAASDAIVNILEDYLPEVILELDDTIKVEISNGKISSLDWKSLGASLWAKARAEIETGVTNYMQTSGEKDGEVLAAIVAKKYLTKQAVIQKGIIVTHN